MITPTWCSTGFGPRAAIDELVRAREVEVLEIDGDTPSMVLSAL